MEYNVAQGFLETKLADVKANSGMMPTSTGIVTNMFANSLGKFTGVVLAGYDTMYRMLEEGQNPKDVTRAVKSQLKTNEQVTAKIPFYGEIQPRICGIVALRHSGFIDSETALHAALISNLEGRYTHIPEAAREIAMQNKQTYAQLLQDKSRSIYDFGTLMGLVQDDARFNDLTDSMPKELATYFRKIAALHRGNKLGMSWPISIPKFARPLKQGLYHDTISHALQEGVGEDFGFCVPEESRYKAVVHEVAQTLKEVAGKDVSLLQRLRLAQSLPATILFMSGLEAFAAENESMRHTLKSVVGDALGAATTASTPAITSACSDCDDNLISSAWISSFVSTFWTKL